MQARGPRKGSETESLSKKLCLLLRA